jgi:GTP cyclohydrolase I
MPEEIVDSSYVECNICHKKFHIITNTHLWNEHQISIDEYLNQFPNAELTSKLSIEKRVKFSKGVTYEQRFGEEKAKELKESRKNSTVNQMKDSNQRDIRRQSRKNHVVTDQERENNKNAKFKQHSSDIEMKTYKERALEYYGKECQRCGSIKNLTVHHIDFKNYDTRLGGNHKIENLMVLCKSCHSKIHNENKRGKWSGISKIEKAAILILEGLKDEFGLNVNDENFKDTPKRVARAYYEIFEGINSKEEIDSILSTGFPSHYEGIITSNIHCFSMCPHHLLPVEYWIKLGYIPGEKYLGISKLTRVAKLLAKQPILQESFTQDLVNIFQKIKAKGAIAIVEGRHMCMAMRGVNDPDAKVTTSSVYGVFETDDSAKQEFFKLVEFSNLKR